MVKAAAWEADISWPVSGVQKGNSRLVTEAARMPAHTLAVGAQLDCLTETADGDVDTRDCRAETDAVDVGDDAVAGIFLILPVAPISMERQLHSVVSYSHIMDGSRTGSYFTIHQLYFGEFAGAGRLTTQPGYL